MSQNKKDKKEIIQKNPKNSNKEIKDFIDAKRKALANNQIIKK